LKDINPSAVLLLNLNDFCTYLNQLLNQEHPLRQIDMREIVFDTETTGVRANDGDKICEIGALELFNHIPTGKTFHVYCNPEIPMPEGAFAVHGLGDEFLADKPLFKEVADDFLKFIGDANLVAHNASFDFGFINAELKRIGRQPVSQDRMVDTLAIAREKFPGGSNSLDALCNRFGIDNSKRTKHGALLDSELLAEVYLELRGGRQGSLILGQETSQDDQLSGQGPVKARPAPLLRNIDNSEYQAHEKFIQSLNSETLWSHYTKKAAS
jgi:DNA polymerase-3 subunit epsilon